MLLHYACAAFDGWPEFADLAGKIYDKNYEKNGAPRTIRGNGSPYTSRSRSIRSCRGLRDFEADDELYICLIGDRPVEVLATAHSKLDG